MITQLSALIVFSRLRKIKGKVCSMSPKPLPHLICPFSFYQVQKLNRDVEEEEGEEDLKGWAAGGGEEREEDKPKEGSYSEPTNRRERRIQRKIKEQKKKFK